MPGVVAGHAVPTGNLEIAWPAPGAIQVGGWALDADTPDPIPVHVYVDGTFRGAYVASGNRPDVGAAYPAMGSAHGFSALVGQFYGGVHRVCVYAINAGGGVNPALGCANVTLPAGNPKGSLNVVQASPGAVRVVGWALDPDTSTPIATHVYVDGRWAGAVTANLGRPDVAAAFPGYGARHGFDLTVPVSGGGAHQVCTYAINVGRGSANPVFGCATVSLPTGAPYGSVDLAEGQAGGVHLAGWSIDPDTSGPVQVHVYVDGTWTAAVTANVDRPDVGATHPGYGDAHGFDATLPLRAGKHTVCVYGINVGPVAANRESGLSSRHDVVAFAVGGERLCRAAFPGEGRGPGSPLLAIGVVGVQRDAQRCGQRIDIADRHVLRQPTRDLSQDRNVADDSGDSARECLERRQPETLVTRGQNQRCGSCSQPAKVGLR